MNLKKILVFFIILISIAFVVLKILYNNPNYVYVRAIIVPLLTVLFLINNEAEKNVFFTLFLVLFSFSELLLIPNNLLPEETPYYVGNVLYILSFISFSISILRGVNLIELIKKKLFSFLVLFLFCAGCLYYFYEIRVSFASEVVPNLLEMTYYTSLLILLFSGVIHYLFRSNSQTMLIMLGVVALVLSEMFMIIYYHTSKHKFFFNIASLLFLVSFFFSYYQSTVKIVKFKYLDI